MRPFRAAAVAVAIGLLTTVISPVAATAASVQHYVDCSAKQQGDGSRAHPWNRLQQVDEHAAFLPGEAILFRRGTTCHGRLAPSGNGADGAPIVVGAYGAAKAQPTIAGGGTGNFTGAVQLRNQQHWTIQDLHVTNWSGGTSTQTFRAGVSIRNQDGGSLPGILVQRLTVDHVSSSPNEHGGSSREWGGITVAAGGVQGDAFPGITIRDNVVSQVGRTGIAVMNWEFPTTYNIGVRIAGNRVDRARGDGIIVFGTQHSRIDHNVVSNSSDEWPCPLCGPITPLTANAGIWPARSTDVRIDHNEVYGMHALGGDGVAFDSDQNTDRVLFEYNYAHDNEGGGVFFCGSNHATVRFNIFENNAKSAFNFIGNVPANNSKIYNNTVYTKNLPDTKAFRTFNVDLGPEGGKVEFKNNIVYHYATSYRGWWLWPTRKVTTRSNTIIGIQGKGRPHDRWTRRTDPGLRAPGTGGVGFASLKGYRPKKTAVKRYGSPIPSDVTRDFFGKRIDPKHPPRGAAG